MWQLRAACLGKSDLMYSNDVNKAECRALCASCPVFAECDQDALEFEDRQWKIEGFRAGRSKSERIRELTNRTGTSAVRQMKKAAALAEGGYPPATIAEIMGVTERSAWRYLQMYREMNDVAA